MTTSVDGKSQADHRNEPGPLLGALDDAYCVGLLTVLAGADEPLPVDALVDRCDVAESTAYRKLARLRDAGLVEREERLRSDGRSTGYYSLRTDGVTFRFDGGDVSAEIHTGRQ